MAIHIDFETRSGEQLKSSGVWRYSEHPSTSVLCMGYRIDDGPVRIWVPGESRPPELLAALASGKVVKAYNVSFEKSIWRNIMIREFGFPDIPNSQWSCVAAKCAAQALPRKLEDAAKALSLSQLKDEEGKRTMMKLSKPRKETKHNKALWHETNRDYQTLFSYCKQDVEVESLLDKEIRDLSADEFQIWQLDQTINERGIRVDMDLVDAALKIAGEYTTRLTAELPKLTNGEVSSGGEVERIMMWLNDNGVPMVDLTKDSVETILKDDKLPQNVRRVLEIRQELSKTSTKKYAAIKNAVCKDGRLRNLLMYHGASTGRWTGMTVQPQNFPRNELKDTASAIKAAKSGSLWVFESAYPDVMTTLSFLLRSVFVATPGYTMHGGDYSAIEARVLFWLAGETAGLKVFESNQDIYVDLAKVIYVSGEIDKAKRDLGKRGILGCGYGMGKKKFKETCENFGLIIDEVMAERVVATYRDKYYPVVRFWYDQEAAAIKAVETGQVVKCGKIVWGKHGRFLYARLPSGRCLAYFDPRIVIGETPWKEKKSQLSYMAVNSVTRKWERERTYGGKIAENLTQAVARDLMAYSMKYAELMGYEGLLSVHDELITEILDSKSCRLDFEKVMTTKPEWADGLPIKAEVWSGERYSK
jgi:DNA polymerase